MYRSRKFVEQKVANALRNKWADNNQCYFGLMDNKYYLPTLTEVKLYLKYNPVVTRRSRVIGTEGFDCDDYSFYLKGRVGVYNMEESGRAHGWAFGIIWGEFTWINGMHSTNWVLTRNRGLYLLEPQDGSFRRFQHCKGNVGLVIV